MDKKDPDVFHVTSHSQQGGITAGQVFVGGGQRTLQPGDKAFLLGNMRKDVPINVAAALGDGEAYAYAAEMKEFLLAAGYTVDGVDQAVWAPPIVGAGIINNSTPQKIQVGSKPR